MMRILVRGRDTLRDLPPNCGPVAVVSISDDPEDFPAVPDGCEDVLRLHFFDVEADSDACDAFMDVFDYKPCPGITERQAAGVADFVADLPKSIGALVFQCEAGVSRSAGMAAAVARHLGQDDMPFFERHVPNRLVYRLVLAAMRDAFRWRCERCGHAEASEKEVRCRSCGTGEMLYEGPEREGSLG